MNNPERFSAELDALTTKFVEDYTKFREGYGLLFGAIISTLEVAEQGLHSGLFEVYQIVETLERIAEGNPAKLYFPGGTTEKFRNEFNTAMKQLAKQLQKDYKILSGLTKHKRAAAGLYSIFISRDSAESSG